MNTRESWILYEKSEKEDESVEFADRLVDWQAESDLWQRAASFHAGRRSADDLIRRMAEELEKRRFKAFINNDYKQEVIPILAEAQAFLDDD